MKNTIQELRKEFKVYNKKEIMYDVYCDRVNFVGHDNDRDRAGFSISMTDALKLEIPLTQSSYLIKFTQEGLLIDFIPLTPQ